ncbi:MAG TPA: sodium-translocating pyrophosphatase [Lacipirellulaceae bacterium]|nr:sodium-translocating pyrophosphatase [Lacipirellulaceae bacterium]
MKRFLIQASAAALLVFFSVSTAAASEADLVLPDLGGVSFLGGVSGRALLMIGLVISFVGVAFGLVMFVKLRNLPVHRSMRDISELIYETCKTYLITQGKFILLLEVFIGAVMVIYFGWLKGKPTDVVVTILAFSLIGIAGSYGVAWFGIRINTYANSRAAFASLRGKPFPVYAIPLQAGISIGTLLISVELAIMLSILLFVPRDYAGPCFIGFAIGESLGAAALRIAGGIFTKIADIGADLMKIVFKIDEDDARNPGVIADCTGDNAGDSVGPTADGFETYGVTGVALIVFIMLAITPHFLPAGVTMKTATEAQRAAAQAAAAPDQVKLLVWIFVMRVLMVITSVVAYAINERAAKAKYEQADVMDYEKPLTSLVWLTSVISVAMTYIASVLLIRDMGDGTLWWKLATIITCGTLAGAIIPELVKIFTSTNSSHVKEVVASSREGGASLNILSGLTAGNFSAFWMGLVIAALMGIAYFVAVSGADAAGIGSLGHLMIAPSVFAFGLVAFGFLGMGPVTIAVDSYGPVADNAQSVFELSTIASQPNARREVKDEFGFDPDFEKGKHFLEENDGAGNTFKATAKPVLIGTAVVGATTLIFSIIMLLTDGLSNEAAKLSLSLLYPPFLLGLITGGAVIYWFTGASTQAVVTGAYRAVEFIKANIHLDSSAKSASIEDSKRVVAICTKYAQRGMFNIFLAVFFITLAFACLNEYFFIGYLISIAIFGLYQAIFMANAGGAWDNAKKIVEVNLREKGTLLHAATVVGDTVGDPFKDTSSVALNPIIKFTTLFGLLAVELAIEINPTWRLIWAAVLFVVALVFVWRSFYKMRIAVE